MANAADASTRKRLALAIIDFLNTSLTDGTLPPDDRESIEVATSCIADSFKVDPSDEAAVAEALGSGQNLLSIYSIYEKLKGKSGTSAQSSAASTGSTSTAKAAAAAAAPATNAGEKDPEAEKLKGQGNVAMQQKDYNTAIEFYTKAIAISPTDPIYLSNRAAAYSAVQKHDLAKQDAEMAVASDPKYTKGWSRLGLASFALGDAKGSMEAYKSGIDAEGHGGSDAMKKGYETAKKKYEAEAADDVGSAQRSTSPTGAAAAPGDMPDLANLAGMFGGGGGGGGGGMPDFSQMMNNPMMRQMAQNIMQNPEMMNNIMSNPRLQEMANQYRSGEGGGGGGMPDLSSLMSDPNIAEMARNFMGGAGGGAGGPGAGRGSG